MGTINRANNAGNPLPVTAESTELKDLIQSTELEANQLAQNEALQPQTPKPVSSRSGEPQVTGRRAAVKVGGMAQQYALNSKLDAKKAGPQPGTNLGVGKDNAPPPPAQATAPTTYPSGLKVGEEISARFTQDKEGYHFEFSRPVTKEQAAAILFEDGKLPKGAKLVPGKGNTWTVQVPNDPDSRRITYGLIKPRRETIIGVPDNPLDPSNRPDPGQIYTWVENGGRKKNPNDGIISIGGGIIGSRLPNF